MKHQTVKAYGTCILATLILLACGQSSVSHKDANGLGPDSDGIETQAGMESGGASSAGQAGGSGGSGGAIDVAQSRADVADDSWEAGLGERAASSDASDAFALGPIDARATTMSDTMEPNTSDVAANSGDVGGFEAGQGGAAGTGGLVGAGGAAGQTTVSSGPAGAGGTGGQPTGSGGSGTGGTADAGGVDASTLSVGQSCSPPGTLSCAGAAQKVALICSSGKWKVEVTCSSTQNCDQSTGICTDILSGCAGHNPNYAFCSDNSQQICGPDLVSITSVPCSGTCQNDSCATGFCGDGRVEAGEECDDGNTIAADGCEPDCKASKVTQLTAGLAHTCALLREGNVRCWGANDGGQLGLGNTSDLRVQKPYQNGLVQLGAPAAFIVAGGEHTCALMQDSTVRCWGKNGYGQLGLGHTQSIGDDEIPSVSVATVQLGVAATTIAAGGNVTCALLDGGSVRCWGRNNYGQLGLGHTRDIGSSEIPSATVATVALDDTVRDVGTGGDHTCVVLDNNNTRCWGRNDFGQLGTGNTDQIGDNELPTAVPAVDWTGWPQFGTIQPSATRTYAWFSDGSGGRSWGNNDDGGLGLRYTGGDPTLSPTEYGNFAFDVRTFGLAVGGNHGCICLQDNELRCWGINDKGQLGLANTDTLGDNEPVTYVAAINLGSDSTGRAAYATVVGAGWAHTCAVLNTGIVRCWGANANGQLGLGYINGPGGVDFVGGTSTTIPALLDPVHVFAPSN